MRRILLIVGPQASGKTETAELIAEGRKTLRTSLWDLSGVFGLSYINDEQVIITDDLPSDLGRYEKMLRLVASGEPVLVERMGRERVRRTFNVTIILTVNHVPKMSSAFRKYITILETRP